MSSEKGHWNVVEAFKCSNCQTAYLQKADKCPNCKAVMDDDEQPQKEVTHRRLPFDGVFDDKQNEIKEFTHSPH